MHFSRFAIPHQPTTRNSSELRYDTRIGLLSTETLYLCELDVILPNPTHSEKAHSNTHYPINMASHPSDPASGVALDGISIAQLSTISLARLHNKDPAEIALLNKVCSNAGFLYLDFRGDAQAERVLAHLSDVNSVVEKYFGQPNEAKAVDTRLDIKDSQDLGYKRGRGGESFEVRIPDSFSGRP